MGHSWVTHAKLWSLFTDNFVKLFSSPYEKIVNDSKVNQEGSILAAQIKYRYGLFMF
jgi:hypothetical protein